MKRAIAHGILSAAGVLALGWSLTLGANPTIACREVTMQPGDVCTNAQGTKIQTYEERMEAAQQARPVIGGVGAAVALFGGVLIAGERRKQTVRSADRA